MDPPSIELKRSKSLIHSFMVKGHNGLTINPYQGCHHRCGYCYATYEWSPEFYDKIYAKSNAPELLENQLKSWKFEHVQPVMISSATDAYQPAELKYDLTRRCVEVLQKYNFPYYVFTKSVIIERDLSLHQRYRDNCFLVWSITTCDEKLRRLIEPGTPPSYSIFDVIRKFVDAGVCCGVNIDPILPLITDSPRHIERIIGHCREAGVQFIFGAVLRLRSDIWERVKSILSLLGIKKGIEKYKNEIYKFKEPLAARENINAKSSYEIYVLQNLKKQVLDKKIKFDFPDLFRHSSGPPMSNQPPRPESQTLLSNYI
jgi:DNA repair photolyase